MCIQIPTPTAETLAQALLAFYATHGWCKGAFAKKKGRECKIAEGTHFCIRGAMMVMFGWGDNEKYTQILCDKLRTPVMGWNDSLYTKTQMMKQLRKLAGV